MFYLLQNLLISLIKSFLFVIIMLIYLLTLFAVTIAKNITTATPTWVTSNYFRAGYKDVISTLTGNASLPQFTFTFSSPLTATPGLAYGIKNYRGNSPNIQETIICINNFTKSAKSDWRSALSVSKSKSTEPLIYGFWQCPTSQSNPPSPTTSTPSTTSLSTILQATSYKYRYIGKHLSMVT